MWLKGSRYQPAAVPCLENSSYFSRGDRVSNFKGIFPHCVVLGFCEQRQIHKQGFCLPAVHQEQHKSPLPGVRRHEMISYDERVWLRRAISVLAAVFRAPLPMRGFPASCKDACAWELCFWTSCAKTSLSFLGDALGREMGAPGDAHRLLRGWWHVWEGKGKPSVGSKWEVKKCQYSFFLHPICVPFWRLYVVPWLEQAQ